MFPVLYSETDKNEIKFLLHYFQQQILSEYFNVICKTKRLHFFYLGIGVQRRNLDIFLYGIQLLNIVLTTF